MKPRFVTTCCLALLAAASQADIFHNYENLAEGFLGQTYSADGVVYRDVNNVSGNYADGTPFSTGEPGTELIVEDATLFYNDFPTYGSPNKSLTFGLAFIPGENLSIGALASFYIDYAALGQAASFDIGFYENGPWGGIEYRLEALLNGSVVASDSFIIAGDGTGRDNPTFTTLSVSGATFDSLHVFARLNGEYTVPRGMIDNLSITSAAPVPEPGTMAALGFGALLLARRRTRK